MPKQKYLAGIVLRAYLCVLLFYSLEFLLLTFMFSEIWQNVWVCIRKKFVLVYYTVYCMFKLVCQQFTPPYVYCTIIEVCIYCIMYCSTVCLTCHMLPYRVSKAISVPAEIWSSDELLTNSRKHLRLVPSEVAKKLGIQFVGLIFLWGGLYRHMVLFQPLIQKITENGNKLVIWRNTVKAPNFDRVFMKNIFLLHIFVRWPPLKKIDRVCKIKVFVVPNLKNLFCASWSCKERFSEGVEVTIWASNFDRYKQFLTILFSREECRVSLTRILLKIHSGDM